MTKSYCSKTPPLLYLLNLVSKKGDLGKQCEKAVGQFLRDELGFTKKQWHKVMNTDPMKRDALMATFDGFNARYVAEMLRELGAKPLLLVDVFPDEKT